MHICSHCMSEIDRHNIEYYNNMPVCLSCKISNMINDGCSFKDAVNMLVSELDYDEEEAIYYLNKYYNW